MIMAGVPQAAHHRAILAFDLDLGKGRDQPVALAAAGTERTDAAVLAPKGGRNVQA